MGRRGGTSCRHNRRTIPSRLAQSRSFLISPLAILAALPEEIREILDDMGASATTQRIGMRDYHLGTLYGRPCVVTLARVGKVAAAATTATLIRTFEPSGIVFTGLAGGIGDGVRVGDVVVGSSLLQYDLDARPLYPRFEVPLLDRIEFEACSTLVARLHRATTDFLDADFTQAISAETRRRFGLAAPTLHQGLVATGDRFISDAASLAALKATVPSALCVEMEGAAVAQVCHEFAVPCAVLRTISDRADNTATVDFKTFLHEVASVYSAGILRRFMAQAD